MPSASIKKHYVQPTVKGQVTLPITIRRKLAIDQNTLFDVTVVGDRVVLAPVIEKNHSNKEWETVVDFTKISPSGVMIDDVLNRLQPWTKSKKRSKN